MLTAEQRRLSIAETWNHELLVERIAAGWTPEDEPEAPRGGESPREGDTLSDGKMSPESETVAQMRRDGVQLGTPHPLTHYVYGPTRLTARRLETRLRDRGLDVEIRPSASANAWLVLASHTVPIDEGNLNRLRDELAELARQEGGDYDGWEVGGYS